MGLTVNTYHAYMIHIICDLPNTVKVAGGLTLLPALFSATQEKFDPESDKSAETTISAPDPDKIIPEWPEEKSMRLPFLKRRKTSTNRMLSILKRSLKFCFKYVLG